MVRPQLCERWGHMELEAEHRELLRRIRRTAVLRGFLVHVLIFLTGMITLSLADASPQMVPIAFGWLIGLALHGATAGGLGQHIGQDGEERRLEAVLCSRDDGSRESLPVQDRQPILAVHEHAG